jgi:hypothetical protein
MNKICKTIGLVTVIFGSMTYAFAAPYGLKYKLAPGQRWVAKMLSQSETTFMGNKNVTKTKTVIEYKVTKGPKKGWVSLVARIKSQKNEAGENIADRIGLTRIEFRADMHSSGEIRNIHSEGRVSIPRGGNTENLPPEMAAMMQQSANFMAEVWKNAVFWFPELPEDKLEPGDEFEVTKKMGAGSAGAGLQTQTLTKQVFTLEDVSDGLAYFSVKERSLTKTKGVMGGKSETKSLGKSKAMFDLKEGMWVEFVTKYRSKVQLGGGSPMGQSASEVLNVTKYEMEKQ